MGLMGPDGELSPDDLKFRAIADRLLRESSPRLSRIMDEFDRLRLVEKAALMTIRAFEKEQADALAVLRDLVALHYEKYTGKDVTWVTDRIAHADIVWARARALVAEHTTDEETT